jgi:hypothetical protein
MKKAGMNAKILSESFSKTFSKGVSNGMHLKWQSYLLLFENMIVLSLKTGHESPDSDPRLQLHVVGGVKVRTKTAGDCV